MGGLTPPPPPRTRISLWEKWNFTNVNLAVFGAQRFGLLGSKPPPPFQENSGGQPNSPRGGGGFPSPSQVSLSNGLPLPLRRRFVGGARLRFRGGMGTGGGPTRARPVAPQARSVGGPDRRLPPRAGRGAAQTTTDPVRDRRSAVRTHDAHAHPHVPPRPCHCAALTAGAGGPTQRSRWRVCAPPRAGAATAGPTTCHGVGDTRAAVPGPRHDARGQGRATEPKDQVCRS